MMTMMLFMLMLGDPCVHSRNPFFVVIYGTESIFCCVVHHNCYGGVGEKASQGSMKGLGGI